MERKGEKKLALDSKRARGGGDPEEGERSASSESASAATSSAPARVEGCGRHSPVEKLKPTSTPYYSSASFIAKQRVSLDCSDLMEQRVKGRVPHLDLEASSGNADRVVASFDSAPTASKSGVSGGVSDVLCVSGPSSCHWARCLAQIGRAHV